MNHTPSSLPRRRLLAGSGATLAAATMAAWMRDAAAQSTAAALKPLPAYVNWKDPASMIVHSNTTIETRRGAFGTRQAAAQLRVGPDVDRTRRTVVGGELTQRFAQLVVPSVGSGEPEPADPAGLALGRVGGDAGPQLRIVLEHDDHGVDGHRWHVPEL